MTRNRDRGEGGAGSLVHRSGLRVARLLRVELLRVELLRVRLLWVRLGTVLRMHRLHGWWLHGELCGRRLTPGGSTLLRSGRRARLVWTWLVRARLLRARPLRPAGVAPPVRHPLFLRDVPRSATCAGP